MSNIKTVVSKIPIAVGMLHIPGKNDNEYKKFTDLKPKHTKSNFELIYGEFYQ